MIESHVPWGGREPRQWQAEALEETLRKIRHEGRRAPLVHACTGAGKSAFIAELAALARGRVLVTTPTQALVEQLAATLRQRMPGVGRAYQHAWEPDRRVVVTCNPSIGELLADEAAPEEWACWIADEAHRAEGDVLRELGAKIRRKVAIGLTATPFRADRKGLETWDCLAYSYPSSAAVRDGVLVPFRAVRWDGVGDSDTDSIVERWVAEAEGPGIVSATCIEDAENFAARLRSAGIPAEAIHQRIAPGERVAKIRRLEHGTLRCLVHVQLLAEGIDLPWLRWLALRRPVGSPVRLVQEAGRVLRASPGKTEAVLYDPHDLLGDLGLVHAAALEDAQAPGGKAEPAEAWEIPELEGLGDVSRLPPARAVDAVSGWVTDLLGALRADGLAPPPAVGEGRWRDRAASAAQEGALQRMLWAVRYLPAPEHRQAVRWLLDRKMIRAGTASDLISVLKCLADAAAPARASNSHWRCPVKVPPVRIPEAA